MTMITQNKEPLNLLLHPCSHAMLCS